MSVKAGQKLRTRRVKTDTITPNALSAIANTGRDAASGSNTQSLRVDDISISGARVAWVGQSQDEVGVRVGDRLETLEIRCDTEVLYSGQATVRYVLGVDADAGPETVVGVAVSQGGIDMATLYRVSSALSFSDRFKRVSARVDMSAFPPDIVFEVIDASRYMRAVKAFLEKEEAALEKADKLTREQTIDTYIDQASGPFIDRLNHLFEALYRAHQVIEPAQHDAFRAFVQEAMLELWLEGPIVRRSYKKPLGYAGDYEIMNAFYREHREGHSAFAMLVNLLFIQAHCAQAVINRLDFLKAYIDKALDSARRSGTPAAIASIGSGPAREVARLLESDQIADGNLTISLVDQDEHAMRFCETTLRPLADARGVTLKLLHEPIGRVLAGAELESRLGPQDLIYSAGLFDYLNDRSFEKFAQVLYDAVKPGGQLVIGNVNTQNPSRGVMEFIVEWYLIHRDDSWLAQLGSRLAPSPSSVQVVSEATGVNLFIEATK